MTILKQKVKINNNKVELINRNIQYTNLIFYHLVFI